MLRENEKKMPDFVKNIFWAAMKDFKMKLEKGIAFE